MNKDKAQNELDKLKDSDIGIFKTNSGVYELIVKDNTDSVDTIYINSFGVIYQSYNIPLHYGKKGIFPDNKNMNEMLNYPFGWNDFIESCF